MPYIPRSVMKERRVNRIAFLRTMRQPALKPLVAILHTLRDEQGLKWQDIKAIEIAETPRSHNWVIAIQFNNHPYLITACPPMSLRSTSWSLIVYDVTDWYMTTGKKPKGDVTACPTF